MVGIDNDRRSNNRGKSVEVKRWTGQPTSFTGVGLPARYNNALSPSDEQYFSSVIEHITLFVRREYPAARAMILTGSAARNEATFLRSHSGTLWLSDIEFIVVMPDGADAAEVNSLLSGLAKRLEQSLQEQGTTVSLDLEPTHQDSFRSLPRNLFGYEFRVHGKQLFGDREYAKEWPAFTSREIPMEDAWRLLSNRMVEWIDFESKRSALSAAEQFYRLTKQYLDLVTSLTLVAGRYSDRYETRAQEVAGMEEWLNQRLKHVPLKSLVNGAALSCHFKLHPDAPEYRWLLDCEPADFRKGLAAAGWSWMADDLFAIHAAVWDWELTTLSGIEARSPASMLHGIRQVYGWQQRIRGWGKLVLKPYLRKDATFFPRMARLLPIGDPRGLVFWCARLLADGQNGRSEATLRLVRQRLPVIYKGGSTTWEELSSQCVRNWKAYLRR